MYFCYTSKCCFDCYLCRTKCEFYIAIMFSLKIAKYAWKFVKNEKTLLQSGWNSIGLVCFFKLDCLEVNFWNTLQNRQTQMSSSCLSMCGVCVWMCVCLCVSSDLWPVFDAVVKAWHACVQCMQTTNRSLLCFFSCPLLYQSCMFSKYRNDRIPQNSTE